MSFDSILVLPIFSQNGTKSLGVKFIYSEKATKGPAAKNDTTENPGCFNQILSFESRKGSPVATF